MSAKMERREFIALLGGYVAARGARAAADDAGGRNPLQRVAIFLIIVLGLNLLLPLDYWSNLLSGSRGAGISA